MASITDITEPKRVRAELEAAHERFVAVLDGLDAAVYVADAPTTRSSSPTGPSSSIYGFDAVGRTWRHLRPASPPDTLWYDVDPRRLDPDHVPRELYDGELRNALSGRWYHIRERAIRWVDGRVVRMAIATDITDRKRVDEENRAQQERLQRTSRLITMGEMASTLAHELNQPLAAIANYSAGCVNRLQSGEYRREDILTAMQKASAQAERAGKIIRRVREFVKKERAAPQPGGAGGGGGGRHRLCRDRRPAPRRHQVVEPGAGRPAAGVCRRGDDRAGGAQPRQERHRGHARHAGRRAHR
jgi:signal transduction histidine kinase